MLEVSHLYAWWPIFRVKHGWFSDGLRCNIMTILTVFDGHDSKIMSWRIMSTWCSNRVSAWSCTNTHKTCDRRVWWRWKWRWTSPMVCTVTRSEYYWGVRKRFPPPASYSDLDTVLEEERLIIPLVTVKDFDLSFPKWIGALFGCKMRPSPS